MKVVVFGATGDTGIPLVKQLLLEGHEVTALVRKPENFMLSGEKLEVVKGDVLNPSTIEEKLSGKDAVLSVLGGNFREPTTVYSEGIKNIISEMDHAGVKRLICLSAETLKLKEETSFTGRILVNILWKVLHNLYRDMQCMEAEIYKSNVDWTIFRPPYLTKGAPKGHYQINLDKPITKGKGHITRSDLALAMIHQLKNPDSIHRIAYVCAN
ncbi:SDR family oxidoreductase [Oceanobacillus jeddahense]|uniref:SDR family oxidoreductase n=1 Tax=Oceanobacillus jeddahense TaxID=1462527 RepID=A0ABY5JX06_9BACI|nr:SDR family oxidoreductase [Oceanobacillus jeddahense]UUI04330.1 SDR family oxidoreductase [Oceanobacillus jeddahense]